MVEYYYVSAHDHEVAARKGIAWLVREARATTSGWVAVPHVSNMEAIGRYRGFTTLKQLAKPPYQGSVNGLFLSLITQEKLPYSYQDRPVLVIFPPTDYLDALHSIPDASKMLVVPWSRKEVQQWIDENDATILNDPPEWNKMAKTAMRRS